MLAVVIAVLASANEGRAQAIRTGFTNPPDFGRANDASVQQTIPFEIFFFNATYSQMFVNTNGNVTFDASYQVFTPQDLTQTNRVILAPFFADASTLGALSSPVRYGEGLVNGRTAFAVDWIDVGYDDANDGKLNSFQLVVIDRSDVGLRDFDFEFNYERIEWETGQSNDQTPPNDDGLGPLSARAGYSNGTTNPGTFFEFAGSAVPGAFLDSNPLGGLIASSRSSSVPGRYLFRVRNGIPLTEAITAAPATELKPPFASDHTVIGTVTDGGGNPVSGFDLSFAVVSGPNAGASGVVSTDANGEAAFTYAGSGAVGIDRITVMAPGHPVIEVVVFWDQDCNGDATPDTCDVDPFGFGGACALAASPGGSLDQNGDGVPDECLQLTVHPALPQPAPNWAEDIAIYETTAGRVAFLAVGPDGVFVYDVSDPANLSTPVSTLQPSPAQCPLGFFAQDLAVIGDRTFVAAGACGLLALTVDPANGSLSVERVIGVPGVVGAVAVGVSGSQTNVYLAVGPDESGTGEAAIEIIDVTDLGLPTLTRTRLTASDGVLGEPLSIDRQSLGLRDLVFVATSEGLVVVEGSAAMAAVVGTLATASAAGEVPQDVLAVGGRLYVPTWIAGLSVIRIDASDPTGIVVLQRETGIPTDLALYTVLARSDGRRIYVTEGLCGLEVLDVAPGPQLARATLDVLESGSMSSRTSPYGLDGTTCSTSPSSGAWAWNLASSGNHLYVTYGTFSPRSGGFQVFEFAQDTIPEPSAGLLAALSLLVLALLSRGRSAS